MKVTMFANKFAKNAIEQGRLPRERDLSTHQSKTFPDAVTINMELGAQNENGWEAQ